MPCPLCGSQITHKFLTLQEFFYLKCSHCALVFLGPEAPFEGGNVYTLEYIQKRGHDLQGSCIVKAKEATAQHYFSLAEKYVPKGNLLEVGCSTGIMLKVAQKRGWGIHGIEINTSAAAIAAQTLGVKTVEAKELTDDMFQGKMFSLIVLFDVIEHISDPVPFMNTLRKKMTSTGHILFVTPDINSLSAKILRNKWPHLMPEHTRLYSRESMNFLLEKTHFKEVKSGWAGKFVNVEILRRHLECHPHILFSRQLQSFLKNLPLLNEVIFPFNLGEMYVIASK